MFLKLQINRLKLLYLWLSFSIIYLLLSWFNSEFILRDSLYYNSLASSLPLERIEELLKNNKSYAWVSYALAPLLLYLKWVLIAGCIYLRFFFSEVDTSIKPLLRIAAVAELILILTALVKITLLSFVFRPNTLEDIASFSPLSVYALFNPHLLPNYLAYPLQSINVFEIIYILIIATGLKEVYNFTFRKTLLFTLGSYGIGFLFWMIVVVFIQLQFS